VTQALKKSRALLGITLMLVAAVLAGPSIALAQGTADANVTAEPITILVMLSDARHEGETAAGSGAEQIESGNTDVMAVIHLDPNQQACRALNLLPNTRVTIDGVGNTRMNQAMSQGGVEMSVDVVQDYLGIEIDHYGVIDLDGVVMAIDAIGGITVNNPEAFTVGTDEFPAGQITLTGEQAVIYAAQGGQDAQVRLARQKALVQGLLSSLGGAPSLESIPASAQGSIADIQDHILTDVTLDNALAIGTAYSSCVPSSETVNTIPFVEQGPALDDATQTEEQSGSADPAVVQQYTDWLVNGTAIPAQ
jgi:LCP family protein required for cell wall assembly